MIFLIAFSVRLLYFFEIRNVPPLSPDSSVYQNLSMKIAYGNSLLKGESLPSSPVYIYFLAFLKKISAAPLAPALLIQFLAGSAACSILFLCALNWFSPPVAYLSSLLAALYPMNLFYEGQILPESLVFFLSCLFLFALSKGQKEGKQSSFFTIFITGMSCSTLYFMTVYSLLLFPFVLVSFVPVFKNNFQRLMKNTSAFACGFFLLYATLSFFSSVQKEPFLPGITTSGIHFYIGNNADASGYFYDFTQTRQSPETLFVKKARDVAEEESKKKLSSGEVSFFWLKKSLSSLRENLKMYPRLVLAKVLLAINNFEAPDNSDFYFAKTTADILKLSFLSFGILFPFAAMGAWTFFAQKKEYPLFFACAASLLSPVLFYVSSRSRILLFPYLFLFSASFVVWLYNQLKQKEILLFIQIVIISSSLYVVSYFKLPIRMSSSKNLVNLSAEHIKRGELNEALLDLQTAIEFEPTSAPAYYNLGVALARKGELDKAILVLKKAIFYDKEYTEAYYSLCRAYGAKKQLNDALKFCKKANEQHEMGKTYVELGVLYGELRRLEESIWALQKAVQMDPSSTAGHFNLSLAYARKRMLDPAIYEVNKALEIEEFAEAYFLLGTLYQNTGNSAQAVSALEKAVKLKSDYADAYAVLGTIALAQKDTLRAKSYFKKALEIDPRHPIAKTQMKQIP